ncbi:hypothetical protein LFL96_31280 [Paraburkholderia sp. D15]|uniref:phage baseplate protein n=1 Tax=Paraburkholderia sp. D15 TaxID=2880218 RepID=UPI002479BD6A|nr:hypothetical protein [Paraburkholderia sp. D15]WGS52669.1 hypothetical protein LFL96_31280 [Paraburkholderia sp. D15]
MNILGFLDVGTQLGVRFLASKTQRGFFTSDTRPTVQIVDQVTLQESHSDDMQITDHPVEWGASISDHAYAQPAQVTITAAWSNSPHDTSLVGAVAGYATAHSAAARAVVGAVEAGTGARAGVMTLLSSGAPAVMSTYQKVLDLQKQRRLFDIHTGKRAYRNMMIKSLAVTTDQTSENMLILTIVCREVLIAMAETVFMPDPANSANPAGTASPEDGGSVFLVPTTSINTTALP